MGTELNPEISEALKRLPDWSGFISAVRHAQLQGQTWAPFLVEHLALQKALNLPRCDRAFFVEWQEIWSPRALSEAGIQASIIDTREAIREGCRIIAPRAGIYRDLVDFVQASSFLTDAPETKPIFYVGPDAELREVLTAFSEIGLLKERSQATLVLGYSRDTPEAETFQSLLEYLGTVGFNRMESFLALPSLQVPQMLIREGFLNTAPDGWRHIQKFIDEEGVPLYGQRSSPDSTWRLLLASGSKPWNQCDAMIVFSRSEGDRHDSEIDFIHSAIGGRVRAAWTQVVKSRGVPRIRREPVMPAEQNVENRCREKCVIHTFGDEAYLPHVRLSQKWISTLRADPSLEAFVEALSRYLSFIRKTFTGATEAPIDLIPDNLVVGNDGEIHAFDQEWSYNCEGIRPETIFLRGIIYFLQRQDGELERLPGIRIVSDTYLELATFLLKKFDIPISEELALLDHLENIFRREALECYAVTDVGSALERRWCDGSSSDIKVSLDFENLHKEVKAQQLSQVLRISSSLEKNIVCAQIKFSTSGRRPTRFRLSYPSRLGGIRAEELKIDAIYGARSASLINARGAEKIAALARKEPDGPSAGQRSDEFVSWELELSAEAFDDDHPLDSVEIASRFYWPEATFGELGGRALLERVWGKELGLSSAKKEIDALRKHAGALADSLEAAESRIKRMQSSKAWRLAERARRLAKPFMRTVSTEGSPQRTAVEVLSMPPAAAVEKFDAASCGAIALPKIPAPLLEDSLVMSIVIPVHNTARPWLTDAVRSVQAQSYPHWQLVLVDDGSTRLETREALDKLDDPRITKIHLTSSGGISRATNAGIEAAHGSVIGLMDHDDMLAPSAVESVIKYFKDDSADIVYTDESIFDNDTQTSPLGYFGGPHLKPDYAPDLLLSHNYITHFLAIRKNLLERVGGLRSEFDGAQDFDLLLRLTEHTDRIKHVPEPLYFWRQSPQSTSLDSGAKPEAHLRGKQAVTEALERRGIAGEVLMANAPHFFRVRRKIIGTPAVDIIVPFRDQPLFLQQCLSTLLRNTRYGNYGIICVDNGSEETLTHEIRARFEKESDRIRFIDFDGPFNFSRINNFAVEQSAADHIVLMNNDIEVINADWLEAMLEHSQRQEVGAVGAKLFYPDDTIQHAGIAIGIGGYAGHPHKHEQGGFSGYLNRLSVIQNVSAVTAALLMCRRQVFLEVGGLDDVAFGIACNDVDFCLRLMEKGYRNIFTPYAKAYHHESISRGYEDTVEKQKRFEGERDRFRQRHANVLESGDPYYNPLLRLDTEVVIAGPRIPVHAGGSPVKS